MKQQNLKLTVVCILLFTIIACKNNTTQETNITQKAKASESIDYNGKKEINITESDILWKGYKLFGHHSGNIDLKEGYLVFKNGELTGGSFITNMESIKVAELMDDGDEEEEEEDDGGDDKADLAGHLKNSDFFDTQTYPEASFKITTAKKTNNLFNITGTMTIKDQSHEISFPAQIINNILKANISIDRTLFGVKYGSGSFFDNLGDNVIKDKFDLIISLKMK